MKIFSAEQIYAADKFTIQKQEITSDALMERSAIQIFNWIHTRMQGAPVKIHLFCGIGNNGGDGVAVARHLQEHGYHIAVYVVNYSKTRSPDFLLNLERLKDRKIWPEFLDSESDYPEIGHDDIIVDAIFGIGFNRIPEAWVIKLMQQLQGTKAFILSIDVPSGLYTDKSVQNPDSVLKADFVLSFQAPKLIFFLPETGVYLDQWQILDIGLDPEFLMNTETEYHLIGKNDVLPMYLPRKKFAHKGNYGHSLIIGGSKGKIGSVHLAAKACLLSGAGLVTAYVPECGLLPLQTNFPEGMVLTDSDCNLITDIDYQIIPSAIGVGMGMGQNEKTVKAFSKLLAKVKSPMVIDADALNILGSNKALLNKLPKQSVLTPHPKELERLIGKWENDFDKLAKAKDFSKKYDCVLLIKGAHSIVIYKGKGYINTTGNPGMATAGSGDVLTGIITGLISQGYDTVNAAIFATYLHGRAGDIALEELGYQALTASAICNAIGKSFIDLFAMPELPPQEQEPEQETAEQGK